MTTTTEASTHGPHDVEPRRFTVEGPDGPGSLTYMHEKMLRQALAGVELGAYDERIVHWLANWDYPTVRVITDLIHRAGAKC